MDGLTPRLAMVAGLVRRGSNFCDVGTDHAFLPVYLIQQNICPRGIASDLREGPLSIAAHTVRSHGLEGKITLILSDGLEKIPPDNADDFIFAGMGGVTILNIIAAAPWLKNPDLRLVLQPQSKFSLLRNFLAEEGFVTERDTAVLDSRHCYTAFTARYVGKVQEISPLEAEVGKLYEQNTPAARAFVEMQYRRAVKRENGLRAAGEDYKTAQELRESLEQAMEGMA